jgi:hypothetical protein
MPGKVAAGGAKGKGQDERIGSDALYTCGHPAVFLTVAMLVFRRLDL